MHKHKQNKSSTVIDEKRYDEEHNTVMDDDYEVSTKLRVDWNKIADEYLNNDDRLNLRRVCGEPDGDSVLAPDADLTAIFEDEEERVAVARSFMKALELRNAEQLQYILLVLSSLLQGNPRRGAVFLEIGKGDRSIMDSFIRVWLRDDISSFCRGKAAICGSLILRWSSGRRWSAEHKSLCGFILQCLREWKKDQLLSPLVALKGVIQNEEFQAVFLKEAGIQKLSHILFDNEEHRQVVYLTVFNLWALTLNNTLKAEDGRAELFKESLLNGTLID